MAFPINTAIPAAGNNPSSDQPLMQTNFANISGGISVDHTAPGSSVGAWQHNQVTFNLNQAAPSIANGVSGLYSNSAAGVLGTMASLFFQNATKNLQLTNIVLTSNTTITNGAGTNYGFVSPWGLIINFGKLTISTSPATVTFAVPMTNQQYVAFTQINTTSTSQITAPSNVTATTMQISTTRTGANTHYYLAIGL